jgi:hypothetical protein
MQYGDKNGRWKGDAVGYMGIHAYVRKRYIKPQFCERCKIKPPLDLANKTGKYLRDLSDWEYLCRKCHMRGDGRITKARHMGYLRRLPDKKCNFCGIIFHPKGGDTTAKYCSRQCFYGHT